MLTRLLIERFKRFENADIPLGNSVVFVGPNNSGKTSALQALSLWEVGLKSWLHRRGGKALPEKRPGVPINRRDLISIPIPSANLLWRDLHVRDITKGNGKPSTRNVRIDISVEGISNDVKWNCGLEFDYANEESFVCRPLRLPKYGQVKVGESKFSEIPEQATQLKMAYLPPMSGLADREFLKQPGEIDFLLGQGQTAQVLRNLCYKISQDDTQWQRLVEQIRHGFGITLGKPIYASERAEITMGYDQDGTALDLSSSGRGLQQTLLLLAHLYANPGTILLLDEPDAHLEIIRQRQTFNLLTEVAQLQGSQIIAASHSEVVLNEAAGRGTVVAFVGKPHRLGDHKKSQVIKALTTIGWDQYYLAEERGWVLYVEHASDLAVLKAFAEKLGLRDAQIALERVFVHYVANNLPQMARDHFFGLQEGKQDLVGIAIFDHLDKELQVHERLVESMWSRREIENYFCTEDVLLAYAKGTGELDMFSQVESDKRMATMKRVIDEVSGALRTLGRPSPWSNELKVSDEFLDPLFREYFKLLDLPHTMRKSDYHLLAKLLPRDQIPGEIAEKLDMIAGVAGRAKGRSA